jgi:hypothetical protein
MGSRSRKTDSSVWLRKDSQLQRCKVALDLPVLETSLDKPKIEWNGEIYF